MTFADILKKTADTGRVPQGRRWNASVVIGSAEGSPNRSVGITVRAPKHVTAAETSKVRSARHSEY